MWASVGVTGGFKQGDRVPPGGTFTYSWNTIGWPTTQGVWLYHDHSVCDTENVSLGAIGIVVIHPPAGDPMLEQDVDSGCPMGTRSRVPSRRIAEWQRDRVSMLPVPSQHEAGRVAALHRPARFPGIDHAQHAEYAGHEHGGREEDGAESNGGQILRAREIEIHGHAEIREVADQAARAKVSRFMRGWGLVIPAEQGFDEHHRVLLLTLSHASGQGALFAALSRVCKCRDERQRAQIPRQYADGARRVPPAR